MPDDEYLDIRIRSSLAFRDGYMLANGGGVIDADYYNNPSNEGHIQILIYSPHTNNKFIPKGTPIAQGIFTKYYTVEEEAVTTEREGGFGSTDKPSRKSQKWFIIFMLIMAGENITR